jgi:hypothetical protein
MRASDLDDATSPWMNGESESVKLDDGRNQVQPEAEARHVPCPVRPIEAPQDSVVLVFAYAFAGILDSDYGFVVTAHQSDLDPAARRRKFDGVIDEIGDRLDQKIAVTMNVQFVWRLDD